MSGRIGLPKGDNYPVSVSRIADGACSAWARNHRRIAVLRTGMLRAGSSSGKSYASPGVVVFPERIGHFASDRSAGSLIILEAEAVDRLVGLFRQRDPLELPVAKGSVQSVSLDLTRVIALDALAREIEGEIGARQPGFETAVFAKLSELVVTLYRYTTFFPEPKAIDVALRVWDIEQVMRYVQERYDEPFSLDDIAARCAMNTTSFSREFKRVTGSPLFEYLNKVRVTKSCSLLKRTQKPVIEIAMDVGYNNVSFFNRYFKKIMGMSPTTYRAVARR